MIRHWFDQLGRIVGLEKQSNNPYECGSYFLGNEEFVKGFAWYYPYNDLLAVSRCEFTFTKDIHLKLDENIQYLGIRLDYSNQLPPGKILAFVEENKISFNLYIKKGTKFAYTEVVYAPHLYHKHFNKAFANLKSNPVEIIKNMSGNYNWPANIVKILISIHRCQLSGPSAELFYIGKACELLSELIELQAERIPHKLADFDDIQRVIRYINEHYKEDIKQADLVRIANMSPTKLKTLFKSITDQSITDFILEKKTDLAIHLLTETDMSIEDIARSTGFTTISGFSTSFRKRKGISPSQYRKQMGFNRIDNISFFEVLGIEINKDNG